VNSQPPNYQHNVKVLLLQQQSTENKHKASTELALFVVSQRIPGDLPLAVLLEILVCGREVLAAWNTRMKTIEEIIRTAANPETCCQQAAMGGHH
jgi:hypothetical protein